MGIWDLNSGPLEGQQVLLADKLYFQPKGLFLLVCMYECMYMQVYMPTHEWRPEEGIRSLSSVTFYLFL